VVWAEVPPVREASGSGSVQRRIVLHKERRRRAATGEQSGNRVYMIGTSHVAAYAPERQYGMLRGGEQRAQVVL